MPRWTYETANKFLVDRRKQHGNIAPYTYLERDGDMIVMQYGVHKRKQSAKELIRLYSDGRVQFIRPWNCPSIRERLNFCAGWNKITNYLGYWELESKGSTYSFKDGMILHPDGSVTGYDPEPREAKVKAHLKKNRDRCKLHNVTETKGFSVGDIVFHHKHEYLGYDRVLHQTTGKYAPLYKDSVIGPLKIKRFRVSDTRSLIWLTDPNGDAVEGYKYISMAGMNLKKNEFLSAVEGAAKALAAK